MEHLPPLIVLVGPTGSGKSALAATIARRIGGELISADSRQLYRGLSIGTAKDPGRWITRNGVATYLTDTGVVEHLVDVLDPDEEWSVAEYQQHADHAIREVRVRGHVPILVGGTGLYIQAVVDRLLFPSVPPNDVLRAELEQRTEKELLATYRACDPVGATTIDSHNKRRLIRAIEVCIGTGQPFSELQQRQPPTDRLLIMGPSIERVELFRRIDARVLQMIANGLVEEVRTLIASGAPTDRGAMTSIGYRSIVAYLQGKMALAAAIEHMQRETRHLAKRQMTWFKRDARTQWVHSTEEALALVDAFLHHPAK